MTNFSGAVNVWLECMCVCVCVMAQLFIDERITFKIMNLVIIKIAAAHRPSEKCTTKIKLTKFKVEIGRTKETKKK